MNERTTVPLSYAYRLINHGPATLVTSRAGGRSNVMAAQWVMPIDYDPPKLAIVVDRTTFTHGLIEPTGVFGLSVPGAEQAELTWRCGSTTGGDIDKLATLETFAAAAIDVPLIAGCIAWLECRVLRSPALDEVAVAHELLVCEVLAAAVDPRCWQDDRLVLDERRTLHHHGGGLFCASGERIDARGTR